MATARTRLNRNETAYTSPRSSSPDGSCSHAAAHSLHSVILSLCLLRFSTPLAARGPAGSTYSAVFVRKHAKCSYSTLWTAFDPDTIGLTYAGLEGQTWMAFTTFEASRDSAYICMRRVRHAQVQRLSVHDRVLTRVKPRVVTSGTSCQQCRPWQCSRIAPGIPTGTPTFSVSVAGAGLCALSTIQTLSI